MRAVRIEVLAVHAGVLFRTLSGDFQPPEGACPTYRGLYNGLEEFERDLRQHVHLENNIVFPRALCFSLWTTGVTLRWIAGVVAWHWRILLPLSALLEVAGLLLFFYTVAGHRAGAGDPSLRRILSSGLACSAMFRRN